MLKKYVFSLAALLVCSPLLSFSAAASAEIPLPSYNSEALCSSLAEGSADPVHVKALCQRVEQYFNGTLLAMHPAGEQARQCIQREKTGSYASLYFCMKDAKVPSAAPESAFAPATAGNNVVLPEYDINTYCKETTALMNGGAALELMCRQTEAGDKAALQKMEIGPTELRYCINQNRELDGAYSLLRICIDSEQQAMRQLGN